MTAPPAAAALAEIALRGRGMRLLSPRHVPEYRAL